jgi:hypothetical protein
MNSTSPRIREFAGVAIVAGIALLGATRRAGAAAPTAPAAAEEALAQAQFTNGVAGMDPRASAGVTPPRSLSPRRMLNDHMQAEMWRNANRTMFDNR